jgi:hypothetical protein
MEQKMIKRVTYFLVLSILFSSCYYDVEADLYPSETCVSTDMSFSKDVEPILVANCNGCHSNAAKLGNITLEGYANTKIYVDNGGLVGSIKHSNGFSPMPKGGAKLIDCNITKIEAWISQGSKNN